MTGSSTLSTSKATSDLQELPPSAKLVAKMLEYEGDQTQAQLADSTRLPARTVRKAWSDLEAEDIVTSRVPLMDARQHVYTLTTGTE